MKKLFLLLALTLLAFLGKAQWPTSPDQSVLVTTGSNGANVAVNQLGESFITIPRSRAAIPPEPSGSYDLYMQKLTPTGVVAWVNDVLVANKYTGTGVYAYALIATQDGGAVATYYYYNASYKRVVLAHKINGNGTKAWEVQLSENSATESYYGSDLLELPNGDIIATWDWEGKNIYLQKIKPNGTLAWASPKLLQPTVAQYPSGGKLGRGDGNNFFITYGVFSARNAYNAKAKKYDSDGTELWPAAADLHSIAKIALLNGINRPVHDGDGGMTFHLTYPPVLGRAIIVFQQVNSAGTPRYPGQGLVVAQSTTKQYLAPVMCLHKPREALFIAYRTGNTGSSVTSQGTDMQRVSLVSDRMEWGIEGKSILPMTLGQNIAPGMVTVGNDENPVIIFLKSHPDGVSGDAVIAKKLDLNGFSLWDDDAVISNYSKKSYTLLSPVVNGRVVLVWCDGVGNVRAQRFLIGD